jgi:hypothetical protein
MCDQPLPSILAAAISAFIMGLDALKSMVTARVFSQLHLKSVCCQSPKQEEDVELAPLCQLLASTVAFLRCHRVGELIFGESEIDGTS